MAIITRAGKGSALTWAEVDNNFTELLADTVKAGCLINGDGATTQSITNSANVKVTTPFATVVLNDNTWWDTTNKKFLPTTAGKYLICTGVALASMADQTTMLLMLWKNGAELHRISRGMVSNLGAATIGLAGSAIVSMNGTTDYIEVYVLHTDSAARSTEAYGPSIFFQARLLP
jgi:hypothetical protein